ncbi:MarR family winged helix-turn-helix transcriptional regulator [Janibacter sp. GS2]|uniref:MarR family winged helix-turn-helix transcriptional regulator n=1 Tax=Janibacter sp. GS2 TaxID=3442646 RepID=UPI003EB6E1F0
MTQRYPPSTRHRATAPRAAAQPEVDSRAGVLRSLRELTTALDQWIDLHGGRQGVHRTHLNALAHLMRAEDAGVLLTPGELAEALPLSASATTALVDRLVAAGHAERHPHPQDRRRTVLTSTASAHETGGQIFGPLAARLGVVVDELDDSEVAVVTRFLDLATRAMTAGDDGE